MPERGSPHSVNVTRHGYNFLNTMEQTFQFFKPK